MHQKKLSKYTYLLPAFLLIMVACKKEEYTLPAPNSELSNDVIKRTLGPNIVGDTIQFAYAMALPPVKGKLASAQVDATVAGATGTFLENKSFYTKSNGQDTGVLVGSPSVNTGMTTKVTFNKDTSAATLRYFYLIPEEARGKTVSFTFSVTSSNGATANYTMGPYTISKMSLARNLVVNNATANYISVSEMKVYNAATAATNAANIDLVYLYRAAPATFLHSLVSPAADAIYLPGVTLPAGVNKSTKMRKVFSLQDYNLAYSQFGIYIDDLDFQQLNLSDAPNFAINLKAEAGTWVETADGRYRAYIYMNSVSTNGTALISMKRYDMQIK